MLCPHTPARSSVKIVSLAGGSDYSDAIRVGETIARTPGFLLEGGAGNIARRLTRGRGPYPRLLLSQNAPFIPICDAWRTRRREWPELGERAAKDRIDRIESKVLSNRRPPYAAAGGLYDALVESGGDVLPVTNEQAAAAARLFEASEGMPR